MSATARALEDPREFATVVARFVGADPARSTVLATVLADVLAGVRTWPGASWLVAEDVGEVVGVAMQTPPHRLWLSAMSADAATAVAGVMAERMPAGALPGIAGAREAAATAAGRWQELRPAEALTEVRAMRSYALDALLPPSDVPGSARLATAADVPLLHTWQAAFGEEVALTMHDIETSTAARLAGHGAYLLWEHEEEVVSLAGHSAQVSQMVRVGPVYTPPEHRRRGFGAAVTAAASRHAVEAGALQVVLFTDLANPTSNSIYQQIGYRPGGDFVELDLA